MIDRDALVHLLKVLVKDWRSQFDLYGDEFKQAELDALKAKTEAFLENEFGVSRDSY